MNIEQVKEHIEDMKKFGDIPIYAVEIKDDELVVCRNDGQFHDNPEQSKQEGYATFVGRFTVKKAIDYFLKESNRCDCKVKTPKGVSYHPSMKAIYWREGAGGKFVRIGSICPNCHRSTLDI